MALQAGILNFPPGVNPTSSGVRCDMCGVTYPSMEAGPTHMDCSSLRMESPVPEWTLALRAGVLALHMDVQARSMAHECGSWNSGYGTRHLSHSILFSTHELCSAGHVSWCTRYRTSASVCGDRPCGCGIRPSGMP